MKRHMIDPPSGWKYGFPKELPPGIENTLTWLVHNANRKLSINENSPSV